MRRGVMRWCGVATLLTVVGSGGGAQEAAQRADTLAAVSGVVFDSLAQRPLDSAVVQLISAADPTRARTAFSAANGAFRFDSVGVGTYLLGFHHARLDSVGLASPLLRVDVRAAGEIRAPLAIPSPQSLRLQHCGQNAVRDSVGLLMGFVRQATAEPLGFPRHVRVRWAEIAVTNRGIERSTPTINAETGDAGGFAICGVPLNTPVLIQAWVGADSSGFVDIHVPSGGFLLRDVYVGRAQVVQVRLPPDTAAGDSVGVITTARRGQGILRGVVRRSEGEPIAGARLSVWGTGIDALTDARGAFAMASLPPGTSTLEVRALGFMPRQLPVDVVEGRPATADITLETFTAFLDTVRVTTQRVYTSRSLQDFERRKRGGFGYFLDESAIEQRRPIVASDLFRMIPGITILRGQAFGDQVVMRGSSFQGPYCIPAVFLDGMRMLSDGNLEQFVNPQDVRAVEVYTRTASIPPEFQTLDGCGSIVIWTGGRRAQQPSDNAGRRR